MHPKLQEISDLGCGNWPLPGRDFDLDRVVGLRQWKSASNDCVFLGWFSEHHTTIDWLSTQNENEGIDEPVETDP